ncbi:putative toxin-antitoxin system toxin component, PIN family [Chroococcus sp. FPU101]|uniref:putative toxin-antitoxin system toxin component, PIN family n=1 Tax=Chroococcus sp. FPU101 TaxID=1974212 RepID=UPI001A8DA776|nr:putative toxin-antitoxin system toxin component, PIN family [Chroococcus sp. FPU101]
MIHTNTLVSRLLLPNSILAQAVRLAIDCGIILICNDTQQELELVLNRKKFDKYVSLDDRQEFLRKLNQIAQPIQLIERFQVCRDEKDNKFLELAVNEKANFIVTGDQDLLILNPFMEIQIITPKNFVSQMSTS